MLRQYNEMFPYEQQQAGRNAAGINIEVEDDVDLQAYGDVAVPDPALDVPVPHNERLHGMSVRDALIGLASQR